MIENFYLCKTGYYASYCKACNVTAYAEFAKNNRTRLDAYTREYATRNYELIASLKNKPCADCANVYPPYVMDFDHLPGERKHKKISAMATAGYSEAAIRTEAAKCDVVCANCHRERTFRRQQSKIGPTRRRKRTT